MNDTKPCDARRVSFVEWRERWSRTSVVPVEVVCAAMAAKCHCDLDAADGHETHECDCGGQWTGTNPEYRVVRFPQVFL